MSPCGLQYEGPATGRGPLHDLDILRPAAAPCQTPPSTGWTPTMNDRFRCITARLAGRRLRPADRWRRAPPRLDPSSSPRWPPKKPAAPAATPAATSSATAATAGDSSRSTTAGTRSPSLPAAMNPGENADYAAGMISGLLLAYGGNVHRALSAYNAGSPGRRPGPRRNGRGGRAPRLRGLRPAALRTADRAPPRTARRIRAGSQMRRPRNRPGSSLTKRPSPRSRTLSPSWVRSQSQAQAMPSLPPPRSPRCSLSRTSQQVDRLRRPARPADDDN